MVAVNVCFESHTAVPGPRDQPRKSRDHSAVTQRNPLEYAVHETAPGVKDLQ